MIKMSSSADNHRSRSAAIDILRAAADSSDRRPAKDNLLAAIVSAQRGGPPSEQTTFYEALAGGGSPGRRWKLVYVCGRQAVTAARGGRGSRGRETTGGLLDPGNFGLLQWFPPVLRSGQFVDGFVTAIQRFDAETMDNENGIFEILGSDLVQLTVRGPFKWPQPDCRSVCAFLPNEAIVKLGAWRWNPSLPEPDTPFEDTKLTKLPFFKFIHVDEKVAVAQGRSGSVALWARHI